MLQVWRCCSRIRSGGISLTPFYPIMYNVAGLALLFQNPERRRTLALYMLARLLQCRYNSLKAAGRWHFWGSDWQHGDTLLFALSSAQASRSEVRTRTGTRLKTGAAYSWQINTE